jgi:hypothetical protein
MVVCEIDGKNAVINSSDVGDFLDFMVEWWARISASNRKVRDGTVFKSA